MKGHAKPRVSPPVPKRSDANGLVRLASSLGYELFPWQREAARYLTAEGEGGRWQFREVAVIVARQNGKTTLLVPLIMQRLLAGQRVMHTAQNRELPREVFGQVAELLVRDYRKLLRSSPRFANGQEEVRLLNGGHYRIVAPTRGGARGPSNDLVIVDELREMVNTEFIGAAKPTLIASPKGQIVYLSNAGTDDSMVLNALRERRDGDPGLAYLEWSAAPGRRPDDMLGWREANPAIGHMDGILQNLRDEYRANVMGRTLSIFETEHLCRWATSLRQTAFAPETWARNRVADPLGGVAPPFSVGIGIAPDWQRATLAMAALREDGRIGVEVFRDLRGDVVPATVTDAVMEFVREQRPRVIAFDGASGGAGAFERHGLAAGLDYDGLKPGAMIAATMDFYEMVMAGRLAVDDPLLDYQIRDVVKRMVGPDGAFRFSRAESLGAIDAVEAALLAAHQAARPEATPAIF